MKRLALTIALLAALAAYGPQLLAKKDPGGKGGAGKGKQATAVEKDSTGAAGSAGKGSAEKRSGKGKGPGGEKKGGRGAGIEGEDKGSGGKAKAGSKGKGGRAGEMEGLEGKGKGKHKQKGKRKKGGEARADRGAGSKEIEAEEDEAPADKAGGRDRALQNLQKQRDHELAKHRERQAKIEQTRAMLREKGNDQAAAEADDLLAKENERHQRAMQDLTDREQKLMREKAGGKDKQGATEVDEPEEADED
jgi:hypothetical protein